MPTAFPAQLDQFTNPTSGQPMNNPSHSEQHANLNDAVEAIEAKLGKDGSTVATSHEFRISQLEQTAGHTHIFNETPAGEIDGDNVFFNLADSPVADSLMLFLNGLLLRVGDGNDFTLSGSGITFEEAPPSGSWLIASYIV